MPTELVTPVRRTRGVSVSLPPRCGGQVAGEDVTQVVEFRRRRWGHAPRSPSTGFRPCLVDDGAGGRPNCAGFSGRWRRCAVGTVVLSVVCCPERKNGLVLKWKVPGLSRTNASLNSVLVATWCRWSPVDGLAIQGPFQSLMAATLFLRGLHTGDAQLFRGDAVGCGIEVAFVLVVVPEYRSPSRKRSTN